MLEISDNCTGCGACYISCKDKCISMEEDSRGFVYPVIDYSKCASCGACEDVCARTRAATADDSIPEAYGMYSKNLEDLEQSSSGGIYGILARGILNEGGIVFGAAMDEDCQGLSHIAVTRDQDLFRTQGSKYLQSRLGDSFYHVRKALERDRQVMFTGTPCQIDGLLAYLDRDYENLLTVEVVCHGVPSPMLWRKYLAEQPEKIVEVNFRNKKYGWELFDLELRDGQQGKRCMVKDENPYMRLFLGNYSLRPSCYQCSHKSRKRRADLTLGDFWKASSLAEEIYNRRGTSLVIANTTKGRIIAEALTKVEKLKIDYNMAADSNRAILNSAEKPSDYEEFWKDTQECSTIELCNKYNPLGLKDRVILQGRKLKRSLER